jgi:hypothetical protein
VQNIDSLEPPKSVGLAQASASSQSKTQTQAKSAEKGEKGWLSGISDAISGKKEEED